MGRMKIIVILLAICMFSIFTKEVSAETFTRRLSGNDRYETASEIIQYGWQDESTYALLASGTDYPDALSAAPLAKKYNAPIVITDKDKLNDNAVIELKRLDVKNVFIIGGEGAVSANIEDTLNSMNIMYTRISGGDRYSTSVEVAKKLGSVSEAFLVTGSGYADALSVASIAAKMGAPVLLTPQNEVPSSVKQYLDGQKVEKVYVIGDKNTISDEAISGIPGTVRISGKDAYERNINIINKFVKELNLGTIYVASGENFPDALSGAAVASSSYSPIMLMDEGHTDSLVNFMKDRSMLINNINVLGGEGVISLSSLKKVFGSMANYAHSEDIQYIKNISSAPCTVQGEWIYYSCFNKQDPDGLYRVKPDGSGKTCLDTGIINGVYIDGEIIYYNNGNNLYTIKIDGTNKQLFIDDLVTFLEVKGDWIYYNDSKGIFKIKKDGSSKKALVLGYIDSVEMYGNYIYYNYAIKDMICKIDINGNNYKIIENSPSYILFADNNYIYYKDYALGKFYKILKNGQGKELIGQEELDKLKANMDNEFIVTYNYPVYNGENIHLKYGNMYLVFNKDVVKYGELDKISLIDEAGEKVNIKEALPRSDSKSTFIITPEEEPKKDTKYTLFIPKGTIQSESGEFYNRYININFKMEN